jgi:hypothetical protein
VHENLEFVKRARRERCVQALLELVDVQASRRAVRSQRVRYRVAIVIRSAYVRSPGAHRVNISVLAPALSGRR